MLNDDFRKLIADSMAVSIDDVTQNTALANNENFDSLAVVSLIAAIDGMFGISVKGIEVQSCRLISDLIELINIKILNGDLKNGSSNY